jgi:hypothetical protein
MKAIAIRSSYADAPEFILKMGNSSSSRVELSVGREYQVCAISRWRGVLFFQVVNDASLPDWFPAWLFRLTEQSLASDWIFSTFDGEIEMVIGPSFIASSISAYQAMVELHPASVKSFWQNIRKAEETQVCNS